MGLIDFFKNLVNKTGIGQEFSQEFSGAKDIVNLAQIYSSYTNSGVQVTENPNKFKVEYDGLLAKNGAAEIYAVVGYGSNQNWENTETFQLMPSSENTFEADIPIKKAGNINIAFKDSANNWDNNSGMNYTFSNPFKEGSV